MASAEEAATGEVANDRPRSRRGFLAAGVGGVLGAVAATVGRAVPAAATAGYALIQGRTNDAGTSMTVLKATHKTAVFRAIGRNSTNGAAALFGVGNATGNTYGVRGDSASATSGAAGVYARATGGSANGLLADATAANGYGVYGRSTQSIGVSGLSQADKGVQGLTTADSDNAAGVYGGNSGTTSKKVFGVFGSSTAANVDAAGVRGESSGQLGNGVYGYATAPGGYGVYGKSEQSVGVFAITRSATQPALRAAGNAEVTGTLTKGGGAFRIDHPLDPANKYLQHSFVESPDMKNVYDGVATLDADGQATVELPDWFEALNRDFRYQLTAIGRPGPGLFIKRGVRGNRFVIAGGEAGQEVSWQVTGIRHDAFAKAHRIEVEVPKRGADRGRYLHPKELGKRPSLGIPSVKGRGGRPRLSPRPSIKE